MCVPKSVTERYGASQTHAPYTPQQYPTCPQRLEKRSARMPLSSCLTRRGVPRSESAPLFTPSRTSPSDRTGLTMLGNTGVTVYDDILIELSCDTTTEYAVERVTSTSHLQVTGSPAAQQEALIETKDERLLGAGEGEPAFGAAGRKAAGRTRRLGPLKNSIVREYRNKH
ncbi:hypothetical protein EI94DRAFT_1700539 [Lactarius quietus]|nr:hypothetical protein EI94DRAFT_1700539 [Lactarius quietus]